MVRAKGVKSVVPALRASRGRQKHPETGRETGRAGHVHRGSQKTSVLGVLLKVRP